MKKYLGVALLLFAARVESQTIILQTTLSIGVGTTETAITIPVQPATPPTTASIPSYVGGTSYSVGNVIYDPATGYVYKALVAHVSTATFAGDSPQTNWSYVGAVGSVTTWTPKRFYVTGQFTIHLNQLIQRIVAGISTSQYDGTEAQYWTVIGIIPGASAGLMAYVDNEAMPVSSVGASNNGQILTLTRAALGTSAAAHAAGTLVYVGQANQFLTVDQSGACTTGTAQLINVLDQKIFSCPAGTWVGASTASSSGGATGPAGGALSGTYPNPGISSTAVASSVFGRTGAVTSAANDYTLSQVGLTGWVDPAQSFNGSGSIATTTGTCAQNSNQLTVVSAAGWTPLMGISVAGAIAGGSELGGEGNPLVTVTAIAGTTFTLSANCTRVGGVTGVTVNHEDSGAIIAAKASGKNVHLSCGGYNVTSRSVGQDIIALNTPLLFVGDGACTTIYKRSISGAVIRISADNFGVGIEGGRVSDMTITQGSGFTPSDGPAVYMASARGAGFYVNSWHVARMLIIGECGGFYTGVGVNVDWFTDSRIYSVPVGCVGSGGITVNTPQPGGDINFNDIMLAGLSTGVNILNSDTNLFTNLKVNGGNITINPASDNVVQRVRFVDTSIEGQTGSPTNAVNAINHTSNQVEFIGGGIGLSAFVNGINCSAICNQLRVVGMHFYNLTGDALDLTGGSASIVGNDLEASTNQISLSNGAAAAITGNTSVTGSKFLVTNASGNRPFLAANDTALTNTIGAGTICTTCYSGQTFPVASLPACNAGVSNSFTNVSDAAASPVYNIAAANGGTVVIPVYCNGTSWVNH